MNSGLGEGIGYLIILVLIVSLVVFSLFACTFIKNKYVSSGSFIIFSMINFRISYIIYRTIKDLSIDDSKLRFIDIIPIISFCGIIVSIILWGLKEKTFARYISIFSILANVVILSKI